MLRGCLVFPFQTTIKGDNVVKNLQEKLLQKGEKPVVVNVCDVGFTVKQMQNLAKNGNVNRVFDAVIAKGFELQKDYTFIIVQGFDIEEKYAVFDSMMNEKLALAMGIPVFGISEDIHDMAGHMVSEDIEIMIAEPDISDELIEKTLNYKSDVISARMIQFVLIEKAKQNIQRIVLPEGNCNRIIQAVGEIKRLGYVTPILIGNKEEVQKIADDNKIDISGVEIVDPQNFADFDDYVATYYNLRKDKGMTLDKAKELMSDVNYFATMMVHKGVADGMVSGAVHTTAETIRPALQFIKTKPGISVVSGAFLMCFKNRISIFGDCAVMPNPSPEQLAEIAAASADMAKTFGISPRVAMISYASGASGQGEDVDAVIKATEIARTNNPDLIIEGPLQFDAAIDPSVAKTKMPKSKVAGKANVFVFPDLNTGNNVYKAVQRSAENAVAMGPILQGLKKPVNDLSRGSTVLDIINTVAITALQAQNEEGNKG